MGLSESEQRRAVRRALDAAEALGRAGLDPETTNSVLRNAQTAATVLQQHAVVDRIKVAQGASALGVVASALVASGAWGTKRAAEWAANVMPGLQLIAAAAEELSRTSRAMLDSFGSITNALTLLADAAKAARKAYEEALPENLRAIPNLSLSRLCDFMAEEGVSLYAVPRTSTAQAFLNAPDHAAVRALLGSRATAIVADCQAVWAMSRTPATLEWIDLLAAAVVAYEAGHHEAAQALVVVVLDSIVFTLPGDQRRRRTTHAFGDRNYEHLLNEEDFATALVAIPLWSAYEENWAGRGHAVPAEFNRHATMHRASKRQYSKRNAMQSLMLATGMVVWYATYIEPAG